MKKLTLIAAAAACLAQAGIAGAAMAGPLENLERERAIAVQTILDPALTPTQREEKLQIARHRLVDLERMVIRDQTLVGNNKPVVRVAFRNYDLTFLVHGATENKVTLADQWFDQIGMTSNAIMDARAGRRW